MNVTHYIGFDVHKKSVSYCAKTGDGQIVEEGRLLATFPLEIRHLSPLFS